LDSDGPITFDSRLRIIMVENLNEPYKKQKKLF
jgi:hypothetical protein